VLTAGRPTRPAVRLGGRAGDRAGRERGGRRWGGLGRDRQPWPAPHLPQSAAAIVADLGRQAPRAAAAPTLLCRLAIVALGGAVAPLEVVLVAGQAGGMVREVCGLAGHRAVPRHRVGRTGRLARLHRVVLRRPKI